MARSTLHDIYLLKCTSCFLDFESLGSAKEYPKGRPLCLNCWDTKQERICDTHGVYHCKACKQSRDSYRLRRVLKRPKGPSGAMMVRPFQSRDPYSRIKKKYRDAGFNGPMFRDEKDKGTTAATGGGPDN